MLAPSQTSPVDLAKISIHSKPELGSLGKMQDRTRLGVDGADVFQFESSPLAALRRLPLVVDPRGRSDQP